MAFWMLSIAVPMGILDGLTLPMRPV